MRKANVAAAIAAMAQVFFAIATLSAQTLSGDEIMAKVFGVPKPTTSIATLSMVIAKNGQTLTRTLALYSAGDNAKGESEKSVMKFLAPGDIKGSGFLSIKKADGMTESLLWLPAMGKVRRLSSSGSDQDSAFFGSDFTNRDIGGFVQADYSYEVAGFSQGAYTVAAVPKKKMVYDKLIYLIDAQGFLSRKIDYYRAGKLVKSQAISYVKAQGYDEPASIVMTSASGSSTELKFSDYILDSILKEQTFTERFLKQ
jgi:hypothetical protein